VDFDVIVVGGGGAGTAAAIEAGTRGARTLVLEQAGSPGGTTAVSSGGCLVAGTPLQRAYGIVDSPEAAFEDWVAAGHGAADEVWARYYLDHALDELYLWAESLGLKWVEVKGLPGNRVPRWHRIMGGGAALATAMAEHMGRIPSVQTRTSTTAQEIIVTDGVARGVKVLDAAGCATTLLAHSIVVATGGFASDHAMVRRHSTALRGARVLTGSAPGATGSGHRMVERAGGLLTHMDAIWYYVYATPDFRDPHDSRGLVFRVTPAYIWVNQAGRRFHDETRAGAASATPAVLSQDPPHAWAILDAPMTAAMEVEDLTGVGDGVSRHHLARELLDKSPFVHRASSLAELGGSIGVDVPTFLGEIRRYEAAIAAGHANEPEFGRPLAASAPFRTAPFYAIQLVPLARKTLGGVKTDLRCRVLSRHGLPIAGLYAAGEVAGMAGGHINGHGALEGTMLGPSILSGRVAGAWAAGRRARELTADGRGASGLLGSFAARPGATS
jgi:predicted oxidoreductase